MGLGGTLLQAVLGSVSYMRSFVGWVALASCSALFAQSTLESRGNLCIGKRWTGQALLGATRPSLFLPDY